MAGKNHVILTTAVFLLPFMVMCSRYDYELFENFEMTKESFIKEQNIVRKLENIRQNLHQKRYEIARYLNYFSVFPAGEKDTKFQINRKLENWDGCKFEKLVQYTAFENKLSSFVIDYGTENVTNYFNYNISVQNIIDGSQKGLIMLHETYDLDIKGFAKGHLNLKGVTENRSRRIDSLQPDDLASMSTMAINTYKWYDNSIEYLKEAIHLFNTLSNKERSELPSDFESALLSMKDTYSTYHNEMLVKKQIFLGPDWKLYRSLVNNDDWKDRQLLSGKETEDKYFRDICNGKVKGGGYSMDPRIQQILNTPKCHFVHHFNPYVKLGPFHIDVKHYWPFRTIIHDFFTEKEMDWMLAYSRPRLSTTREVRESTSRQSMADRRYSDGNDGQTVAKTVQTWVKDIAYTEEETMQQINSENEPLMYEALPLTDPYNFTIQHDTMVKVSKRIELVTHFNVTKRHGSSQYQTTNYGLGGLVVPHMDPWGYEHGVRLVEDRAKLVTRGDYIATFMGWLENVPAGGGTAFAYTNFEGILEPTKGSAAFWINLSSCHIKDHRSKHGGCPILKGSKWILNKWINSWDQWKDWPCHLQKHRTIDPFDGMSL